MDERYDSAVECGREWFENQELYHHGIKGQKWGVRRFQDENGRLTEAGRARYSKDVNSSRTLKGISKGSPMTMSEADCGRSNIHRPDKYYNNKEYERQMKKKGGYLYNCQSCVVAYEARLKGYDITAGSRSKNPTADALQEDITKAFIDPTTGKPPVSYKFVSDLTNVDCEYLKELYFTDGGMDKIYENHRNINKSLGEIIKPGGRYILKEKTFDVWSGDYREHYWIEDWTKKDESPVIVDPQRNYGICGSVYEDYYGIMDFTAPNDGIEDVALEASVVRVDGLELNYDIVEDVVERR